MPDLSPHDDALIEECRLRAIDLLHKNLSAQGILAATAGARAHARGYTAIFGRDAAICALGMALSGNEELQTAAATAMHTLAAHQAENGQIPKFVATAAGVAEADFWYLGCIDATLWWLIALALLDDLQGSELRDRYGGQIAKAIYWLECQEHQHFRLLQQNEASDWADIMPRSGFVLYTNALWHWCKRLYALKHAETTRLNANQLFYPFGNDIAEYKRARLLAHYVKRKARNRELYLSFVNFAFYGDEGDVFGNILAILCGLTDEGGTHRILHALEVAGVNDPYPVRVVVDPIVEASFLWRPYMSRHQQNFEWQYHNGGIWPFVGGFWVAAQSAAGRYDVAQSELLKLAQAAALGNWAFTEWLHGKTLSLEGMQGQSWNAAAFLFAHAAVTQRRNLFATG
ncbi:MAG TPA: glycoside hydrolase 100 family protein [Burkholderiales bacterium]|nr:glycoside hydrolase 100 family protein [Burkholderiales bacterium]